MLRIRSEVGKLARIHRRTDWCIAIYHGESPLRLHPVGASNKAALTARSVTDIEAAFVADPFMLKEASRWYMFLEVMNARTGRGNIGYASSPDGLRWDYGKIVLQEPFELSYPYVFRWGKDFYMVPETRQANSIRLYRAIDFPDKWIFDATLVEGRYLDPSILYYQKEWWMFAGAGRNDTLHLFKANSLRGRWDEHPHSPVIVGDAHTARPGGRIILLGDRIIRYSQDDSPTYGNRVRAFEITTLTPQSYQQRLATGQNVLKGSGTGWNADGMHHVDAHEIDENSWIACVDGWRRHLAFG